MSLSPKQFHQAPLPFDKPIPQKVDFVRGRGWTGPKIHEPNPESPSFHVDYTSNSQFRQEKATKEAAHMQKVVQSGRPAVRFPAHATPGIQDAGRFKTQYETQNSRGSFSPWRRARYEEAAFGYPSKMHTGQTDYSSPMPVEHRPVYGFIDDEQTDRGSVAAYGEVKAVLKKRVLDRTTITPDDSLEMHVPVPYKDVVAGKVQSFSHGVSSPGSSLYTEAQFHGGVRVSDIDHIEVTDRGARYDKTDEAKEVAEVLGVQWRHLKERSLVQPPLGLPNQDWGERPDTDTWIQRGEGNADRAANIFWSQYNVEPQRHRALYEAGRSKRFRSDWV